MSKFGKRVEKFYARGRRAGEFTLKAGRKAYKAGKGTYSKSVQFGREFHGGVVKPVQKEMLSYGVTEPYFKKPKKRKKKKKR